ncbi:MipA/OmpV family protein [Serratia nevei]|uniref:MipA/OmpV family protein n=1 Tax=Serratia nevei TaxID=2703794 RepID=UPI00313CFDD1
MKSTMKTKMKTKMKSTVSSVALAATLGLLSPLSHADSDVASVTVGAGMAVAPAYEGSSHYAAQPVYDVVGRYHNADWGQFTLGLAHGARWQLPLSEPFGVALLLGYDHGRDERISTLGGHNNQLRGMSDLGGSLEAGLELSYQLAPFKVYVKGMQATRERHYGGESLGHTAYVDMGVKEDYAVSDQLTLSGNVYTTWANSGYERGYFGVTPLQSRRSGYAAYRPDSGIKQVTAEMALNYQWTPSVAFQTGIEVYRLTGDAADSPLVEKTLASMAFVSASYRF